MEKEKEDRLKKYFRADGKEGEDASAESRAFAKLTRSPELSFFFDAREMKIERPTNWLACRKKLMNAFTRGVHLIPDKNNKKKRENSRHSGDTYRERFIRSHEFSKANFALFFSIRRAQHAQLPRWLNVS